MNNTTNALLVTSMIVLTGCEGGGAGNSGLNPDSGSTNAIPTADAGANIDISKTYMMTLDGGGSSDSDGDSLTYTWTQTRGPDVTGGTGNLSGKNPAFAAPDIVDTLMFELIVNDGKDDSFADSVAINVFEDINVTYFVDGDMGDDAGGTGSRDNPFATLSGAVDALTANAEDIYVKTRAAAAVYDETAADFNIPAGTSLYGGYGDDWVRDAAANKTAIDTNHRGVRFVSVSLDAWFSGFDLMTANSPDATEDVFGVFGNGDKAGALYVQNNIISNGHVKAGEDVSPGSNYGIALRNLALAQVDNNIILAGTGGDGIEQARGNPGDAGGNGQGGSNLTGGRKAPGGNTGFGGNGGVGGTRGGGINGNGGNGGTGASGTVPTGGTVAGGAGGAGGSGNIGDNGESGDFGKRGGRGTPGNAGIGAGQLNNSLFFTSNGSSGSRGGHGSGGGGGGGGEANNNGVVGGGGGGGGEGGEGGFGGSGGSGGGASIGVWLHNIATSDISQNTIESGLGGVGANGGPGGSGGSGGLGGSGIDGEGQGFLGRGGDGADGRSGGPGGDGGSGGGGGGGPSYGVIFAPGMAPTVTGNTITSGDGGAGGDGGFYGNGGQGGYSYTVYDRDPTDAFFATLSQNTLAAGAAGSGGTSGGFDSAVAGSDGQTGTRNWW